MTVLSTAAAVTQAFKNAGRLSEILAVFVSHGFARQLQRMRLGKFIPRGRYAAPLAKLPIEARLRMCFEALGPTFVKLGQLIASRPDLVPANFVAEFTKLQDRASTLPFKEIRPILEADLGGPLEKFFRVFEETPLAAASIAQVYAAELITGERVAVKVQRPGIQRLIEIDTSILRNLAVLLETYVPEAKMVNPTGLVEEFYRTMLFETDFRVEANSVRRIGKNLEEFSNIAVPMLYPELCGSRVLVLERFDGIPLSDLARIRASGKEPLDLVKAGADAFFHMVMRDGLFHADPHAGNLFLLEDGRLGFLDFGMVGRLSRRVQDSILSMFVAIVDEDFETLANEYVSLCSSRAKTDPQALQKDLMDAISPYVGMPLGEVNAGGLLLQSTAIAVRHHLEVPRELILLFKAILTLEGIGKRLEPNFDMMAVGTGLARSALTARFTKERLVHDVLVLGRDLQIVAESAPRMLRRFLRRFAADDFALAIKNEDTAKLARSVRVIGTQFVLTTLGVCFFLLGIACLFVPTGPRLLSWSLASAIAFSGALLSFSAALLQGRRVR